MTRVMAEQKGKIWSDDTCFINNTIIQLKRKNKNNNNNKNSYILFYSLSLLYQEI